MEFVDVLLQESYSGTKLVLGRLKRSIVSIWVRYNGVENSHWIGILRVGIVVVELLAKNSESRLGISELYVINS